MERTHNLSKGKEAASPAPLFSCQPPKTHSMGGAVGGMLVLRGLVPPVGRDSVVHEPGGRHTIPGSLAGKPGAAGPQNSQEA